MVNSFLHEQLQEVIAGTGMIGDPLYIPWLIKRMEVPELARLAGESFSLITGAGHWFSMISAITV